MPRWTQDDVPDQSGRTAVVTGASSGIGLEIALGLARKGARVIATSRSDARGRKALDRIRAVSPGADVEFAQLDLAELASVRAFAEDVVDRTDGLDALINNAGVMAVPERRTTADGFELQFGTNYLGHFALSGLLLRVLLAHPGARVVTMTSGAYRQGRIHFDDLQSERRYRTWDAYSQSKLANLLLAGELDRRARAQDVALVSVAAHPGLAKTNLQYAGPSLGRRSFSSSGMSRLMRLIGQSAARGALPLLYAATSPDVVGGGLYGPDGRGHIRGDPTLIQPAAKALDEDVARQLFELSEELTGVSFTW